MQHMESLRAFQWPKWPSYVRYNLQSLAVLNRCYSQVLQLPLQLLSHQLELSAQEDRRHCIYTSSVMETRIGTGLQKYCLTQFCLTCQDHRSHCFTCPTLLFYTLLPFMSYTSVFHTIGLHVKTMTHNCLTCPTLLSSTLLSYMSSPTVQLFNSKSYTTILRLKSPWHSFVPGEGRLGLLSEAQIDL